MAEVSTPGRPEGVPDERYVDGVRRPTTVLPLRKSYTEWTDVDEVQLDGEGNTLTAPARNPDGTVKVDATGKVIQEAVVRAGRQGSKPRYRFYPDVVPEYAPGRLTSPPPWHSVTRDQLTDFMRCGQVTDGRVVIDRGVDPAEGAFFYSIGEVPEGGNPDEIPLILVEEV